MFSHSYLSKFQMVVPPQLFCIFSHSNFHTDDMLGAVMLVLLCNSVSNPACEPAEFGQRCLFKEGGTQNEGFKQVNSKERKFSPLYNDLVRDMIYHDCKCDWHRIGYLRLVGRSPVTAYQA